jgi:tRNA(fMet)-specific endonuclease VapC
LELWYGVAKSERTEWNTKRLLTFLAGPIEVIAFDDDDAKSAGEIRACLEVAGTPIGAYDVLIGGQAAHRGLTLVTSNTSEFARVRRLSWEDWATGKGSTTAKG